MNTKFFCASCLLVSCAHLNPDAHNTVATTAVVSFAGPDHVEHVTRVENIRLPYQDLPVFWAMQPGLDADVRKAITQGFASWNALARHDVFIFVGEQDFTRGTFDCGRIVMVYAEPRSNPVRPTAGATLDMRAQQSSLRNAEITVWLAPQRPIDISLAVAHEIGHLFGLNHERSSSMMAADLHHGTLALSQNERRELDHNYPEMLRPDQSAVLANLVTP